MAVTANWAGAERAPERTGRLLWTDYWFLAAAAAAALVVVDPLDWELAAEPLAKHLALALSLPALLLTAIGARLRTPRRPALAPLVSVLWPLLLLAAFVVAGSLHARLTLGLQNTFLNVGLYLFVTGSAAAMVLKTAAPEALLRAYFRILLAAAAVMAAYLIVNFRVRQVYHEQIFLVIPLAVLCFARAGGIVVRWAGCAFFLAMAWLSAKYTSYIIAALTIAYTALFVAVPRHAPRPGLQRATAIYWTVVLGAMAAAAVALLALQGAFELPTGNVNYRLHTYTLAWERFREAPLWGTLFAVESVEKFKLFSTGVSDNILATHSDVLDLLANGGLLAFGLWLYGLARIARVVWPSVLAPQHLQRSWAPRAHALAVMSAAGVVTYAFNPILLQPSMAYLLWTNLGLLVGLALRMGEHDLQETARSPAPREVRGAGIAAYGPYSRPHHGHDAARRNA